VLITPQKDHEIILPPPCLYNLTLNPSLRGEGLNLLIIFKLMILKIKRLQGFFSVKPSIEEREERIDEQSSCYSTPPGVDILYDFSDHGLNRGYWILMPPALKKS
jgi:hypothetical protein